jgi:hypothetical protein
MGIGWLGAGYNIGSGRMFGSTGASRDYKKVAELYCDNNNKWTYLPDTVKDKRGGTKRKSIHKRTSKTRRHK